MWSWVAARAPTGSGHPTVSTRRKRPGGDPRRDGGKVRDPRRLAGSIIGDGGPRERDGVVLDVRNAILLTDTSVCLVEPWSDGEPGSAILAMQLSGRINKTTDQAQVLFLFDVDGAAALVSEVTALAARLGPEFLARFMARMREIGHDDALRPVMPDDPPPS